MSPTESEQLQQAIENLYRTFSGYRLPAIVGGCSHCVSSADNARIHSLPLSQLSGDDLARFTFKSMTTWGTAADFRHFLPRILELLAFDGGAGWIGPEIALGKLEYGEFRSWPRIEQDAIELYCNALWDQVARTADHRFEIESCICSLCSVFADINPLLARWLPARSRGEAIQFCALIEDVWWPDRPWPRLGGWWDEHAAQAEQLIQWICCPDRARELEQSFFAFCEDADTAKLLSETLKRLAGRVAQAVR